MPQSLREALARGERLASEERQAEVLDGIALALERTCDGSRSWAEAASEVASILRVSERDQRAKRLNKLLRALEQSTQQEVDVRVTGKTQC